MGKTVETKRKKGRPSLLDLQKRSLRLQHQQHKRNPNPSLYGNPYLRFPNRGPGEGRRSTRRNPIIEPVAELNDDGEEDDRNIEKRREKKLKLVLRIHDQSENSPRHSGRSASESEGEGTCSRRKKKIEAFGCDGDRLKLDKHRSLKTTESLRADTSTSGPTTPLPDKKLLLFILDMLQKKDTYGVFSEPVDPEELPDYHEVIEHPMDFSTVRKKLSRGAYNNLEQFEKDVFLISSNAMRYNAPYTIYYRQARSIQDLAKKNFENLRHESDKEPEMKAVVRRGRPPSKNVSRPAGPLPSEITSSDPTLANTGGAANLPNQSHPFSKKASTSDKPGLIDVSGKTSFGLRNSDSLINMNKVDAIEEFPGSVKGVNTRFGKKAPVMEENRRNTYSQFQQYSYGCEMPIWSMFDDEKQQLAPVGRHLEHAYARSLARFAAHLGSIGWAIASKKIEKSLPPGMKFGRGWVGDDESLLKPHPQTQSSSPSNQSPSMISPCSTFYKGNPNPSQKVEPSCRDASSEGIQTNAGRFAMPTNVVGNETVASPLKAPFQLHHQLHQSRGIQPTANGLTDGFGGFNLPSHMGNFQRNDCNRHTLIRTHSSHFDTCNAPISFSKPIPSSMQAKSESIPPDLNIRFQSPGSPTSGSMVDSQQPDLALQL